MISLFRALSAEAGLIEKGSSLISPILGTSSRNRQVMQRYQKSESSS